MSASRAAQYFVIFVSLSLDFLLLEHEHFISLVYVNNCDVQHRMFVDTFHRVFLNM